MILQTVDLQLYSLMFIHQAKQTFLLCFSHNTYKVLIFKQVSFSLCSKSDFISLYDESHESSAYISISLLIKVTSVDQTGNSHIHIQHKSDVIRT